MIYAYRPDNLMRNVIPTGNDDVLGTLQDALTCEIDQDTDALFTLTMEYPRAGRNAQYLQLNNFLRAPVSAMEDQFFCINEVKETENGRLSVQADHISYNADGVVADPFTIQPSYLQGEAYVPGDVWRDKLMESVNAIPGQQLGDIYVDGPDLEFHQLNPPEYTEPVSVRQAILDAVEGRDRLCLCPNNTELRIMHFLSAESAESTFEVRYGKNMISYDSRAWKESFYTHIYPYYINSSSGMISLGTLYRLHGLPSGYGNYKRVLPVDFTDQYGVYDDIDLIFFGMAVETWLRSHPFEPFPLKVGAKAVPEPGKIYELGMWGDVYYTPANYVAKQMITSIKYDVLSDMVTEIGLGSISRGLPETIAQSAVFTHSAAKKGGTR